MATCDATQLLLYTIIVFSNSVYSLASLFLPSVFMAKDISGFWVGIVFAMYSIAVITVSPFVGKVLDKIGTPNLLAMGLVGMGLSIIPLGFLQHVESKKISIGVTLMLRFLQGTSSACINTSCYSTAGNKYPKQTEFIIGMLEAVSGIGCVAGLLGGAAIYEKLGYMNTFVGFGLLLPCLALITRTLFVFVERAEKERAEG